MKVFEAIQSILKILFSWPFVILVIFLYLRVPITDTLREIGKRAEKITTPYGEVILTPPVIEEIGLPDLPREEAIKAVIERGIQYTKGLVELYGGKKDISIGSGFVITKDGYIISDTNVIGEAKEVYIKLYEERELKKAEVIARNDETFLALLKLSEDSYSPLKLGDSRKIEVGESVFKHSLKTGYAAGTITAIHGTVKIYAKKRQVELQDAIITTDISLPGDSGAPLFNKDREVIGIIVASSEKETIVVPVEQLYSVFPQLSGIL